MQKTNFKTRLLALLTAVFMVIMCVPFAAFADGEKVTVHVNFMTVGMGSVVEQGTFEADKSELEQGTVTIPESALPNGWTFADESQKTKNVYSTKDVWVSVEVIEKPVEDRYVTVHFFKDNTNEVGSAKIKVVDGKVTIADSDLPEGWVLEG